MDERRFKVVHYQNFIDTIPFFIPFLITYSCEVYDKVTGNVGYGCSTTPEEAERLAWEDLKLKQSPLPSEKQ